LLFLKYFYLSDVGKIHTMSRRLWHAHTHYIRKEPTHDQLIHTGNTHRLDGVCELCYLENLDSFAVAKAVGINRARVTAIVAVAQRRQVTAHQRLAGYHGAPSGLNVLLGKLSLVVGNSSERRLLVCAERVVDGSPQAPARVTALSLVQNNITPANA